ncbi:Hypothetical protein ORPV_23 [Orpheovirus IHUMI-LCC2]|uniref:Uncharacterized protein n=1 Tax=Orpheovirus IHUMI-LCC2 TaxID=2023057 RepID=A0A2I2L337_9VIRU|nr:Hypothetical protein ORPV_23 [Orpheovirus IHUMI-LCC2]SNW61927.1 Hypothetical protein ORPV_23 [Orpheovirus IHUMI-LCC2]
MDKDLYDRSKVIEHIKAIFGHVKELDELGCEIMSDRNHQLNKIMTEFTTSDDHREFMDMVDNMESYIDVIKGYNNIKRKSNELMDWRRNYDYKNKFKHLSFNPKNNIRDNDWSLL